MNLPIGSQGFHHPNTRDFFYRASSSRERRMLGAPVPPPHHAQKRRMLGAPVPPPHHAQKRRMLGAPVPPWAKFCRPLTGASASEEKRIRRDGAEHGLLQGLKPRSKPG